MATRKTDFNRLQQMANSMTANKKPGTPHSNDVIQANSSAYNPSPDPVQNGAPQMPYAGYGTGFGDGKAKPQNGRQVQNPMPGNVNNAQALVVAMGR